MPKRSNPAGPALGLFAFAVVVLALRLQIPGPSTAPLTMLWVPMFLLAVGIVDEGSLALTSGRGIKASLKALAWTVPVFAIYAFVFLLPGARFLRHGVMPRAMADRWAVEPFSLAAAYLFAGQLLFVALPEEFFFRGFLQSMLSGPRPDTAGDHPPPKEAAPGTAAIVNFQTTGSAALFAAAHVIVSGDPGRLEVFFPGLLFAWLRAATGNIWAPVLAHTFANSLFYHLSAICCR